MLTLTHVIVFLVTLEMTVRSTLMIVLQVLVRMVELAMMILTLLHVPVKLDTLETLVLKRVCTSLQ